MNNELIAADSYVLFEIAGTTYAVRSNDVQQLEMIEHITPVPNASEAVEGVVFSRGQVIPAINLRTRFGFPKIEHDVRSRLVVVRVEGRSIGLIVDAAREFKRIPAEAINPPSETLSGTTGKYLEAIATIGDRLVLLLNLAEVIKTAEEIETGVEN
ncbi:MAG TPA: chemotaxis protein CheW [Pyrinomonadaceae bacterium]|jgi:purine-binding chemotaxis protein CheW|nr:chemotaxis protein CheW [Pyrinomonadaceae bacterium]